MHDDELTLFALDATRAYGETVAHGLAFQNAFRGRTDHLEAGALFGD